MVELHVTLVLEFNLGGEANLGGGVDLGGGVNLGVECKILIGYFKEMVANWPVASCYFALSWW